MPDIAEIAATYDVITPMMMGGANSVPEFRLPSYVNVVRWWWRFLAFGRFDGNEQLAMFWEAVLFGWSQSPFGRKRVSFRLAAEEAGCPWGADIIPGNLNNWSGINYLTAQGFGDNGNGGRKPADVGSFRVEARLQRKFDDNAFRRAAEGGAGADKAALAATLDKAAERYEKACRTLLDAMALVGLLGGLGARSRRGFGSLAVRELSISSGANELLPTPISGHPVSIDDYTHLLGRHLGAKYGVANEPPYSVWSSKTKIEICASDQDCRSLMNDVGWAFQIYRSWGQKDKKNGGHSHWLKADGKSVWTLVAGDEKEWYKKSFLDDHNSFYIDNNKGTTKANYDNRAILGLPHNYGKVQVGWAARVNGEDKFGRRASPLIFHFHKVGKRHLFVCMAVPAALVPGEIPPSVGDAGKLRVSVGPNLRSVPSNLDWSLVTDFAAFVRGGVADVPKSAAGGVKHSVYQPEEGSL